MERNVLRRVSIPITLVVIVAASAIGAGPAPAGTAARRAASSLPSPSSAQIEAQCRPYFHDACSEAIGNWLPTSGLRESYRDEATHVASEDRFIDGKLRPKAYGADAGGPTNGTFFVYGDAGPLQGHVWYDRIHRIAFYQQGCCSWSDAVAASNVPPPSKSIASRDLRGLVTMRGARLGQPVSDVMRLYGPSSLSRVEGRDARVLAYSTFRSQTSNAPGATCGQLQRFFFRAGRLVLIQLSNAC